MTWLLKYAESSQKVLCSYIFNEPHKTKSQNPIKQPWSSLQHLDCFHQVSNKEKPCVLVTNQHLLCDSSGNYLWTYCIWNILSWCWCCKESATIVAAAKSVAVFFRRWTWAIRWWTLTGIWIKWNGTSNIWRKCMTQSSERSTGSSLMWKYRKIFNFGEKYHKSK